MVYGTVLATSVRTLFCESRVKRKFWKIENRKYIKMRKPVNVYAAQFGKRHYKLQVYLEDIPMKLCIFDFDSCDPVKKITRP